MKWSNDYRMRLIFVGFVAAIVFVNERVEADFTWTQKAEMPIPRYCHSTNIVGGKIYAVGGWNPQLGNLTRVDEYDPATDTWTRKADMPTPRGCTSATVANDKIYVIGGDARENPIISIVEVYDPSTDTWAEQTELPSQRYWFSTCVLDGIIYVIGGNKGSLAGYTHLKTVEAYDPNTDTWTTKADMPTGRSFLATCVVDGLIYVIGGGAPGKSAVEVYDPATDIWTTKAPMSTPRYGLDTVVVCGKIYAIGGWWYSLGGPIYSTVEVYDPVTDAWTRGVDIPVTTAGLSASAVDGKIYVMGGATAPHDNDNWILTSAVYVFDTIVDFNGDGIVNIEDLVILIESWGTDNPLCEIAPPPSGDGIVDAVDLEVLMSYWEQSVDDATLMAHWPLDETEGFIVADSAGNKNGYALGDPVWQPESGIVSGALQLDGVDDYVVTGTPPNPEGGAYSVLAWIKGGAPGQVVLSQMGAANWLCTDPSAGTLMTELTTAGRDGCSLGSEAVTTDGNWHRVGFVWAGSYRRLYVDGIVVAEDVQGNLDISINGLYIGTGKNMEPGTFWSGLIDDVRIYNRAVRP
jgi:N-acetylneuraminic acid mutarotase